MLDPPRSPQPELVYYVLRTVSLECENARKGLQ